MTENDREKFAEAFFGLQEYFGKNHSKTVIEIYFKSLQDLTLAQFLMACRIAIKKLRFFPKIAELREFAGVDEDTDRKEKPLLAWLEFREGLKAWGTSSLDAGKLTDPVIFRVVRLLGGMERIRMWTENEIPFRQRDFMEYYEIALRHDSIGQIPFMPKNPADPKSRLSSGSSEDNEKETHDVAGKRSLSVFRPIGVKTFKHFVTPRDQIKKLIRHLIDMGEDVSPLKNVHPEIYDDAINKNRGGNGNPGA